MITTVDAIRLGRSDVIARQRCVSGRPPAPAIYLEHLRSSVFLRDVNDIEAYKEARAGLDWMVLSPADSNEFIADVSENKETTAMTGHREHDGWVKSSFSNRYNCVEFRRVEGGVEVRNSKRPDEAVVSYTDSEWRAFIQGAKAGEFDI